MKDAKVQKIQAVLTSIQTSKRELEIAVHEWLAPCVGFSADHVASLFVELRQYETLEDYILKKTDEFLTPAEKELLKEKLGPDVQIVYDHKTPGAVKKIGKLALSPANNRLLQEDPQPLFVGEKSATEKKV